MWRTLFLLAMMALVASCGSSEDLGAVTRLPDDTFASIDGTEDGELKYPVLELWGVPVCHFQTLITNTPHGTRVRVLGMKANCLPIQYEVEILEGEKAGVRGWVQERFLRLEDGTSIPD